MAPSICDSPDGGSEDIYTYVPRPPTRDPAHCIVLTVRFEIIALGFALTTTVCLAGAGERREKRIG